MKRVFDCSVLCPHHIHAFNHPDRSSFFLLSGIWPGIIRFWQRCWYYFGIFWLWLKKWMAQGPKRTSHLWPLLCPLLRFPRNPWSLVKLEENSQGAFLVPSDVAIIVVFIAISIFALRSTVWRREAVQKIPRIWSLLACLVFIVILLLLALLPLASFSAQIPFGDSSGWDTGTFVWVISVLWKAYEVVAWVHACPCVSPPSNFEVGRLPLTSWLATRPTNIVSMKSDQFAGVQHRSKHSAKSYRALNADYSKQIIRNSWEFETGLPTPKPFSAPWWPLPRPFPLRPFPFPPFPFLPFPAMRMRKNGWQETHPSSSTCCAVTSSARRSRREASFTFVVFPFEVLATLQCPFSKLVASCEAGY